MASKRRTQHPLIRNPFGDRFTFSTPTGKIFEQPIQITKPVVLGKGNAVDHANFRGLGPNVGITNFQKGLLDSDNGRLMRTLMTMKLPRR